MSEPTEEFWEQCLIEASEKFKGHFTRLERRAFILGCAFGFGALKADLKVERERAQKLCKELRLATTECRNLMKRLCNEGIYPSVENVENAERVLAEYESQSK